MVTLPLWQIVSFVALILGGGAYIGTLASSSKAAHMRLDGMESHLGSLEKLLREEMKALRMELAEAIREVCRCVQRGKGE
jgi:hypothetical protein